MGKYGLGNEEYTMKKIKDDLDKGQVKKVYLIFGEEEYYKKNIKKAFIKELVGEADNMNCTIFSGKGVDNLEVMNMCDTLPFFMDKRLVIMENTELSESKDEKFLEYIKTGLMDSTCLVIIEKTCDKRSRLYKAIKAEGYVCECSHLKESDLTKWILVKLSKEGKKITKDVMDYLVAAAGNDLENISNELEKLLCYTMGREVIEISDIDAVCSPEISGKIFAMIDAMGAKKQKETLDLYYDLINTRESPMKILYMIARQFNIMLQVKELLNQGYSSTDIASKLNMKPFIVGNACKQCNNFTQRKILKALQDLLDTEEDIKNGRLEEKAGVEILLIKYSKENK